MKTTNAPLPENLFWSHPSWESHYADQLSQEPIAQLREERLAALARPHWQELNSMLASLPIFQSRHSSLSGASISIGSVDEAKAHDLQKSLDEVVTRMLPWRKGPFELFGEAIDAEWRSDAKWDRIAPHLDLVEGKNILDIGCNNGYYMLRLLEHNPRFVLGIDPSERCWYQFQLLQRFLQDPRLAFDLFGVEHVTMFPGVFDMIFCMGIIYHQRNPLLMLQQLHDIVRPGGQVLIESIGIPGEDTVSLSPPERYAKMHNVYFIPTVSCLEVWMKRAGFKEISTIAVSPMTPAEQRKTRLAPYWSLEDYLDPEDPSKTIEGFPAPLRIAVTGRKRLH